jgi:hypothetical protein
MDLPGLPDIRGWAVREGRHRDDDPADFHPSVAPDGNHVYAIFHNGRGYRWDVRPSAWNDQACAVAGRRLSRAEWHELLPGRDYAPAC